MHKWYQQDPTFGQQPADPRGQLPERINMQISIDMVPSGNTYKIV